MDKKYIKDCCTNKLIVNFTKGTRTATTVTPFKLHKTNQLVKPVNTKTEEPAFKIY